MLVISITAFGLLLLGYVVAGFAMRQERGAELEGEAEDREWMNAIR